MVVIDMIHKNKYFYMICHKLFLLYKYIEDHNIKSAKWLISTDVYDYLWFDKIFNFNIREHTLCGFPYKVIDGNDIVKLMVEI